METKNTFADLDSAKKQEQPTTASKEISTANFSDKAVGDKTKYVRQDLDGKEDVVESFQVFNPDTSEEPKLSQSKTTAYWKPSIIVTYESMNADGLNNREYLSGAKVFRQRDGSASDIQFWYKGGTDTTNQICHLWEKVAKKLGLEPDALSPRQFVAFLNSRPKVRIMGTEYKNFNAPAGSPKEVKKNMIGEFL